MTYEELQAKQWAWASQRFGDERSPLKALQPFTGLVEEIGELSSAMLRGNADDIEDAIGDAVIYLCDLCTRCGWAMPGIECQRATFDLNVELGRLGHSILKPAQQIRKNEDHDQIGQECVFQILGWLDRVAAKWHIGDALSCAETAWDEVSQRSAGHEAIPETEAHLD